LSVIQSGTLAIVTSSSIGCSHFGPTDKLSSHRTAERLKSPLSRFRFPIETPLDPITFAMTPRPGGTLLAGELMRLWGAVTVPGSALAEDGVKATWYIDNKRVAEGLDAFVSAPKAGKHRLRLDVAVRGQRGASTIDFQSVSIPSIDQLEDRKD
jgi:hypothetical protein